jgi:hypothetical protein
MPRLDDGGGDHYINIYFMLLWLCIALVCIDVLLAEC